MRCRLRARVAGDSFSVGFSLRGLASLVLRWGFVAGPAAVDVVGSGGGDGDFECARLPVADWLMLDVDELDDVSLCFRRFFSLVFVA